MREKNEGLKIDIEIAKKNINTYDMINITANIKENIKNNITDMTKNMIKNTNMEIMNIIKKVNVDIWYMTMEYLIFNDELMTSKEIINKYESYDGFMFKFKNNKLFWKSLWQHFISDILIDCEINDLILFYDRLVNMIKYYDETDVKEYKNSLTFPNSTCKIPVKSKNLLECLEKNKDRLSYTSNTDDFFAYIFSNKIQNYYYSNDILNNKQPNKYDLEFANKENAEKFWTIILDPKINIDLNHSTCIRILNEEYNISTKNLTQI